jgi:hypothetical protein
MKRLKEEAGQFLPIAAMVMLTAVVFMVAVVDVYRVSRAKLKVQNLADAVALNIATQEARALNTVADRNEWLNHMVDDAVAQKLSYDPKIIPARLSDVENLDQSNSDRGGYVFDSIDGAKAYASVVQTINDAQGLFKDAYDKFIGASSNTGNPGIGSPGDLMGTLAADIPDLFQPGMHLFVWNSKPGEELAKGNLKTLESQNGTSANPQNSVMPYMLPLKFATHDTRVKITYNNIWGQIGGYKSKTFRELLGSTDPIGWMEPDMSPAGMPTIALKEGANADHIGAGAMVTQDVNIIGGTVHVTAQAQAYIVNGSGASGESGSPTQFFNPYGGPLGPAFSPTYWVKLVRP